MHDKRVVLLRTWLQVSIECDNSLSEFESDLIYKRLQEIKDKTRLVFPKEMLSYQSNDHEDTTHGPAHLATIMETGAVDSIEQQSEVFAVEVPLIVDQQQLLLTSMLKEPVVVKNQTDTDILPPALGVGVGLLDKCDDKLITMKGNSRSSSTQELQILQSEMVNSMSLKSLNSLLLLSQEVEEDSIITDDPQIVIQDENASIGFDQEVTQLTSATTPNQTSTVDILVTDTNAYASRVADSTNQKNSVTSLKDVVTKKNISNWWWGGDKNKLSSRSNSKKSMDNLVLGSDLDT